MLYFFICRFYLAVERDFPHWRFSLFWNLTETRLDRQFDGWPNYNILTQTARWVRPLVVSLSSYFVVLYKGHCKLLFGVNLSTLLLSLFLFWFVMVSPRVYYLPLLHPFRLSDSRQQCLNKHVFGTCSRGIKKILIRNLDVLDSLIFEPYHPLFGCYHS